MDYIQENSITQNESGVVMSRSIVEKIKTKTNDLKSEVASLCSDLIKFPTISPPSETIELTEYIKTYLDGIGLKTTLHKRKPKKTNLHARLQGKTHKRIIWLGHIDVVPPGSREKWSHNPFGGEIEAGKVHGRGTSDMKGSCAAAMTAAKILSALNENEHATMDFWFTCDEEVESFDGTRWLLEQGLLSGDACLVGDALSGSQKEPWVDAGCKGYLRARIKATGKTAHGSSPFYGDNAIDRLIPAVEKARKVENFALDLPKDVTRLTRSTLKFLLKDGELTEPQKKAIRRAFNYPTVSLNLINAGVKINVVPDFAEATFDIRITPGINLRKVEREISRLVKEFRNSGVKAETVSLEAGYYESWDSPFANSLAKAVKTAVGTKPQPKILLGATDGIHVNRTLGIPCLGFGAGIEKLAHAPNEYVTIENLVMAAKVYAVLGVTY